MTTTVKVLIEGNKNCQVSVSQPESNKSDQVSLVAPGSFTTKLIHGEQYVSVVEVGDFLS